MPSGKGDHPVVYVSWNDAAAFAQWLSEETGTEFRLCTEAEWEKACRGTAALIYPWADAFDPSKANTRESDIGTTTQVGSYSPDGDSPYGVADMSGNVWEWTSSLYRTYPYDRNDGREDMAAPESRVMRGGSFYNDEWARCAGRIDLAPGVHYDDNGFRVCVSPV